MIELEQKMTVYDVLTQNIERNAPLLNVVERNCSESIRMLGGAVCLRDRESGTMMFSADNWHELEKLLDEFEPELDTFLVNDSKFRQKLSLKHPGAIISEYSCYIADRKNYMPRGKKMAEGYEFTRLDTSWIEFILSHYKSAEFGNVNYISHRIQHGPGLGVLYGREKVAFVLQHKDGESGPLVVDQKFRNQGIGSMLLCRFNELLFERNSILYGFVVPDNVASAHMMVNCGYRKTENNCLWIYRLKNGKLYLP